MNRKLITQQLDQKYSKINVVKEDISQPNGWISSIRTALNMSLEQLGRRIGQKRSGVKLLEQREQSRRITLEKLMEVAEALDCQVVYSIIPKSGSLEKLIENRAAQVAREIVMRTSNSMRLEDQENSADRLQKSINEWTEKLTREVPKFLWD